MRLKLTLKDLTGQQLGSMVTPAGHYLAPGYKLIVRGTINPPNSGALCFDVWAEVEILPQKEGESCQGSG